MKKIGLLCILISVYCIAGDFNQTKENKGKKNMEIEKVWGEYIEYWEKHEPNFIAPETCKPSSKKEVEELEKSLDLKLPDDFKISLQMVNHGSKKCSDNFYRSWFGNQSDVDLLCLNELNDYREHLWAFDEIDKQITHYYGEIIKHNEEIWPKEWISFAVVSGIYIFFDLRKNLNDKEHGQVLAIFPLAETKKDGFHNRVAFVAKSYTEFMKQALEYIKQNGELNSKYFLELLHLPKNYYEDDIQ